MNETNPETIGRHRIWWNILLITSGSLISALAINALIIPHQLLSGGVTGISLIIYYLFPVLSVGILYFLLNIPIFILGWLYVGKRFFYYSIAGMVIFSAAITWVKVSIPLDDRLLAALLAGIIYGIGAGLTLRSVGSAGGTDVLSIILLKRYSIRLGNTVLFFNAIVLSLSIFLFSIEAVLYTLIYMFVSSKIIDLVVTGFSQRKAVMIISGQWESISNTILKELNRGVTLIPGKGGYSGKEGQVLYTVITFPELSRLKSMVRRIDPNAFVVITDTLEVMGQRIGNQPHW